MSLQEQDNRYLDPHAVSEVNSVMPELPTSIDLGDQQAAIDYTEVKHPPVSAEVDDYRTLRNQRFNGRVATAGYSENSTTAFLNEIGSYDLLDGREEEAMLAMAIKAGKAAASQLAYESDISDEEKDQLEHQVVVGEMSKERFLTSNLRLVVSIAKRYSRPPSVELTDIIQEGVLGLEHAIEKFDYTKGFKFSTYSSNWIKQHITRFLAMRAQSVKVPEKEYSSLRRALIDSDNDNRAIEELPEKQQKLLSLVNLISLDMPIGEGDSDLIDVLDSKDQGPETTAVDSNGREVIRQIIDKTLSPREKLWLTMYHGLDGEDSMSMTKIANISGVSSQTVRTVIKNAQAKLRDNKSLQELS